MCSGTDSLSIHTQLRGGSTMSVEPITITVTINGENLEVVPEEVTIGAGDAVEWVFVGIPENCLAFVHFETEGDELFGPFQYLEPAPTGVIAMGNSGTTGTFGYTALVLSDQDAVATSTGSLSIINTSSVPDTTPHAAVTFNPLAQTPFDVDPQILLLEQGRTAVWYISPENILPDNFVTFHFAGFPATPMTGPFQSFSMSPGLNGAVVARGEGFSSTGTVQYFVRVRNAQGGVVAQDDPVIEPV